MNMLAGESKSTYLCTRKHHNVHEISNCFTLVDERTDGYRAGSVDSGALHVVCRGA